MRQEINFTGLLTKEEKSQIKGVAVWVLAEYIKNNAERPEEVDVQKIVEWAVAQSIKELTEEATRIIQ
jgi:hypothetical protein